MCFLGAPANSVESRIGPKEKFLVIFDGTAIKADRTKASAEMDLKRSSNSIPPVVT
jgi:hypothetical protein